MVKVGFVVEGPSEKKLIESARFQELCIRLSIEICKPIIVIGGVGDGGRDIAGEIRDCRQQTKCDKVLVLVDLEHSPCFQSFKQHLQGSETADYIIIARRTIEAWFMADMEAFGQWNGNKVTIPFPEVWQDNFGFLKELSKTLSTRGPGVNHLSFAITMLNSKHDFSLERAAAHPHCPSAAYFLDTLRTIC